MSLGEPIPAGSHHSLSVSLPEWKDNVGYQEGEKRVMDLLRTGYPRFIIHASIKKLSALMEAREGRPGERCLPFPSERIAVAFKDFCSTSSLHDGPGIRIVELVPLDLGDAASPSDISLQIVFFPKEALPRAKEFWQHAGWGISSRLADFAIAHLEATTNGSSAGELDGKDMVLDVSAAQFAKHVLRARIAAAVTSGSSPAHQVQPRTALPTTNPVRPDDVFLFPSGMAAIWTAHQIALSLPGRQNLKSVCFGFGYTDTIKVLSKFGPGCHFFGTGDQHDLSALETLLASERVLAIFCETPSNPLLRSVDVPRLRALADQHDCLLVIDETIGNFANVDVLPYADVLLSSLTKVFSGAQNVMGGSLILNPNGRHYGSLRNSLQLSFEDLYWDEDAIEMELNSRDFAQRAHIINQNAEQLTAFLLSHCGPAATSALKHVFYPKWETRALFDLVRRISHSNSQSQPECAPGFGGLLSITFHTESAAHAFYDALACHKGPSLGTNFTLACPYTILAHYAEREWAARYGVEVGIVRISVGLEPVETILRWCGVALDAALHAQNVALDADA